MGSKRKRTGKEGSGAIPAGNAQKRSKNESAPKGIAKPTKPSLETKPFVETPVGDDRKREGKIYELLGSEDTSDQIEAAGCIISSLLDSEGVPESVLQRHLDRRLFRGLASGRNASRIGFSLVITELLGQLFGKKALAETKYQNLTFDKVLDFLVGKAQIVGNIPGQEERDLFFGQLFGIECFVGAQILFEDDSRWYKILDLLLQLGYKKVWLRSQCGWIIVQAIEKMNKEQVKSTLEKIEKAGLGKTPESVAIWIAALERFPDINVKPWRHPLDKKSLGDLAAVLKENVQDQGEQPGDQLRKNKQANWTAQLHFVWDRILAQYIKKGVFGAGEFEQFWSRVVDDGLFSKNATDGQKFKGFMVFQKTLGGLLEELDNSASHIESLFSKNFTTCLMNQAAKEDRFLHRAATKALKTLDGAVASRPTALIPVLKGLLGKNGSFTFDQRTSTKTIDKLLQYVTTETADAVLNIVRQPIDSIQNMETEQAIPMLRAYVGYVSKTLNTLAGTPDNESQTAAFATALQELSQMAYTQPKGIPENMLTEQIRELCRTRLESSFAKLSKKKDGIIPLCNAVSLIDPDAVAMTEEIKTAVIDALSRLEKLLKRKTKSQNEKDLTSGLALLHAVSIFQLYNEDPDAMDTLNDLESLSSRLKGKNTEEGSSELLVEILLAMVARPSSLMRQVSQQVFESFTSQVSAEGLELLTGPLSSKEDTKGFKEIFNTDADDMNVDEEEEEGEEEEYGESDALNVQDVEDASDFEMDSDVEFVGLNGENAEDDESGKEDENEEDSEDDDDEKEEEPEKDETKQGYQEHEDRLAKHLGVHRLDKDVEAEDSGSEADMSDSEMYKFDKHIETFLKLTKEKTDSKKEKRDAKQSVINFKNRILDLLDIYVKTETTNALTPSILLPLLNLMRTTMTKPLANRASEIIRNYQRLLKKARSNKDKIEAPDTETLLGLLLQVHDEAGKSDAHAYTKTASAASLIIVSLISADEDSKVDAIYVKTLASWRRGEAKVQRSFFDDWITWCQNKVA